MDLINGTVRTHTPKLDKMSENKVALTKRVTDVSLLYNTDFGEKYYRKNKNRKNLLQNVSPKLAVSRP